MSGDPDTFAVPASLLEDGSPLVTDLIVEFERARRQWDEYQKTGVSTAAVGSYDLCFSVILKKHIGTASDSTAAEALAGPPGRATDSFGNDLVERELVSIIMRILRHLRGVSTPAAASLEEGVMSYLKRKGLLPSPLRGRLEADQVAGPRDADDLARQLSEMKAERDLLQDVLDARPAINGDLPKSYVRWSQSIYSGDAVRAADAKGSRNG